LLPRLFGGETITEEGGRLIGFRLEPLPPQGAQVPLMVGGNGDHLLTIAARKAAIVQFVGFMQRKGGVDYSYFSDDGLADRIALVNRTGRDPELSVLLQWAGITADPEKQVEDLRSVRSGATTADLALRSPFVQLGSTVDQVCGQILDLQVRHGVSYLTVFDGHAPGFDAVVERLTC
jgi:alkanesulfonate monooxygenase SsuD/methylene tetrahydromethanopterin reductase-like flavin-dependent oxidoreductase (luciferase family)